MKIKKFRISGFRGIPPSKTQQSPFVDIDLNDKKGDVKNLILYGPNAYGKSSIADAVEWFFRESVRHTSYIEEYSSINNVHLNVGTAGYPSTAVIELEIEHNSVIDTVTKEIGLSGEKVNENLGQFISEMAQASEEIIVLDHDQFRRFVTAANKEKWATFSSLIGYEPLDHFRAGLDSLSGSSLTTRLQVKQLEKELDSQRRKWQRDIQQLCISYKIETSKDPIKDIESYLSKQLEVVLISLGLPFYSLEGINDQFWIDLRDKIKLPDSVIQVSSRLATLETESQLLFPFEDQFITSLNNLLVVAKKLNEHKDNFDKSILASFYELSKNLLTQGKSPNNACPLCDSPFDWNSLNKKIDQKIADLSFSQIQQQHSELMSLWNKLSVQVKTKKRTLKSTKFQTVIDATCTLVPEENIEQAYNLGSFDLPKIENWIKSIHSWNSIISEAKDHIEKEKERIKTSLGASPSIDLGSRIEELFNIWKSYLTMKASWVDITNLERRTRINKEVSDALRDISKLFKEELSDFSARVIELINKDVNSYYCILHPEDNIVPYLETDISGMQRKVSLKCNFRGIPGKDATPLLSESHRNSMGLSILLAFMKYKRRLGSPVGFLVLDDVSQSFDVDHRVNLLNLLEDCNHPEISCQQIILLTHDRTFADLVKRTGEESDFRENWVRMDIRNWWLSGISIEPCPDPIAKAKEYILKNDEIAAAVYARQALEKLYKKIIEEAKIRVQYNSKPWRTDLDDYRKYIIDEIAEMWKAGIGFIDPTTADFTRLFTSQRILNMTVHDSSFLDNPTTLGDVQAALDIIEDLKIMFSCVNCKTLLSTIKKNPDGSIPICRNRGCKKPVR